MSTKAARAAERLRRAEAYFAAHERIVAADRAAEQLRRTSQAGAALMRDQQPEAALKQFVAALKMCPTCAEAWVGAGLAENARGNATLAYLNAPQVDPESLVTLVCAEFGLETGSKPQMLQALNTFLLEQHALGRNAVLIVDEAQALGPAGLEAVRLLSNLETERNKLLQIVMFGQSELDELLQRPDLRQINQRIGFSFATGPLNMAEATHYISHRVKMSRADGIDFPIFTEGAMETLAQSAAFVPRVINILADKALLVAYGAGSIQVTEKHAEGAIDDSPQLAKPVRLRRRWVRGVIIGVIAAEIAAVIALFTFSSTMQDWAKGVIAQMRGAITAPAATPAAASAATPVVDNAPAQ